MLLGQGRVFSKGSISLPELTLSRTSGQELPRPRDHQCQWEWEAGLLFPRLVPGRECGKRGFLEGGCPNSTHPLKGDQELGLTIRSWDRGSGAGIGDQELG